MRPVWHPHPQIRNSLPATAAYSKSDVIPLRNEVIKLKSDAYTASKNLVELKDVLQASQKTPGVPQEQRYKAQRDQDDLLMDHRTF